jgi:hypothetical protein
MAKKVIKKMQEGGMVSPKPIPAKKSSAYSIDTKLGENTKSRITPPKEKSPSDSTSKKPSKPKPKNYEKYLEPVKDNGKLYKKGGSVKKK